jgi:hypothetical protein
MLTRNLDTLLHAIDACQDAGPSVERALPAGGRVQIALAHLLAAAAEVQAALDWRGDGRGEREKP